MMDIYTTCLIVGLLLMIISLTCSFLDGLDGVVDGIISCFDIGFDVSFLPISGTSICGGLAIFGAVGLMVNNIIISIVCGYIFAVIIQTVIRKLKKASSYAIDKNDLYMYKGKIVSPIINGHGGCVLFRTLNGTQVKYSCKLDNSKDRVEVGTVVNLIRFEDNIAVIEINHDKLEKKYSDEEDVQDSKH